MKFPDFFRYIEKKYYYPIGNFLLDDKQEFHYNYLLGNINGTAICK